MSAAGPPTGSGPSAYQLIVAQHLVAICKSPFFGRLTPEIVTASGQSSMSGSPAIRRRPTRIAAGSRDHWERVDD